MGKITSFKQDYSFEDRLAESRNIIAKYPDRIPSRGDWRRKTFTLRKSRLNRQKESKKVIIERYTRTDLPEMDKKKYLVPRDMSVGQFIHMLSSRLHLNPGKALFVFVKNTLPQTTSCMDYVYETYKDDDGFLYMCYSSEKTFG